MLEDLPTTGTYSQVIRGTLTTWKSIFRFFFFSQGAVFCDSGYSAGGWRALAGSFPGEPWSNIQKPLSTPALGITKARQTSCLLQGQLCMLFDSSLTPFICMMETCKTPLIYDVFPCPNSDSTLTTNCLTGPGHLQRWPVHTGDLTEMCDMQLTSSPGKRLMFYFSF